jgi:GNAT superfamily N-acetyltransferase
MINKVHIRKASADDAQSVFDIRIAAINCQCTGHYAAQDLEIWVAGSMSAHFVKMVEDIGYVATSGNMVVGTAMIDLQSGQVDAIFVHPLHMRQGIGRQMISLLEYLAIEAGLTQLRLDSTLNAVAFYRAAGYVGDTVAKYVSPSGVSLDCISMVKVLQAN